MVVCDGFRQRFFCFTNVLAAACCDYHNLTSFYCLGKSIWDTYSQNSGKIPLPSSLNSTYVPTSITDDRSTLYTGNVASDSFYKIEADAQVGIKLKL